MRTFGILRILEFFYADLDRFENNQILLNRISQRFLATAKQLTKSNILIKNIVTNTLAY
jgi:hypothetical protein